MHLASHFCSGFCIGSIISSFGWVPGRSLFRFPVLIGVGAMLPDLDGISVFFNHKVYYGNAWYSHHGAFHSLLGIAFLSLLFTLIITIVWNPNGHCKNSLPSLRIFALLYLGNIIHIIEDLPCPLGPWQGLMILWPLLPNRFGGWSHIWWLNEYLMVVLFGSALSSLVIFEIIALRPSARSRLLKGMIILINLYALFLTFRFVIVSRYINPIQWQEYQKTLLGNSIYTLVKSLNTMIQHIWVWEIL